MVRIIYKREATKALEKIDSKTRSKIITKIGQLAETPYPKGCKKIKGYDDENLCRIKHGNYRVIYKVQKINIVIITLGNRDNIYQKLSRKQQLT